MGGGRPTRMVPRHRDAAIRVDGQLRRQPTVLRGRQPAASELLAVGVELVEAPTPLLEAIPGPLTGTDPVAEDREVGKERIDVLVVPRHGVGGVEQPRVRGQITVGEVRGTPVVLSQVTQPQEHPAIRDQARGGQLVRVVRVVLMAPPHVAHGMSGERGAGGDGGLQPGKRRGDGYRLRRRRCRGGRRRGRLRRLLRWRDSDPPHRAHRAPRALLATDDNPHRIPAGGWWPVTNLDDTGAGGPAGLACLPGSAIAPPPHHVLTTRLAGRNPHLLCETGADSQDRHRRVPPRDPGLGDLLLAGGGCHGHQKHEARQSQGSQCHRARLRRRGQLPCRRTVPNRPEVDPDPR